MYVEPYFKGMVFHLDPTGRQYLPILPRGNPKAPRPPPLHSVMDLKVPKAPPVPSPKPQKEPEGSRTKRHLPFAGSASAGDHPPPLHLPPGPSSPKPRGISSSSSVKRLVPANHCSLDISFNPSSVGLVDNVGGVMPLPNNLDQAEDDAHIPLHKNGPDGKIMLEDDDQDPNGQV